MSNSSFHMYMKTTVFGLFSFVVICIYMLLTEIGLGLEMINKAAATTGVFLIGLSFAMSSISYFWDFADKKLMYRKYFGLIGYCFIVWHFLNSIYFYFFAESTAAKFDLYNNWTLGIFEINNVVAFMFGLTAFIVFSIMAMISNKYAMKFLGTNWRPILRIGYIAIFLGMLHFSIKDFSLWVLWVSGGLGLLPPMSLLTFVYINLVLLLRIFMGFGLEKKAKR